MNRPTMQTCLVPDDFPRDNSSGIVAGAQPKICVTLSEGKYAAGQTDSMREERWSICEDLAHQLITKAQKDMAANPEHSRDVTLERIRVAVVRKGWLSPAELPWLITRLRALLNW
ncbi:hypothetical protein [Paraburkholderia bannensis]|uniref:hypothetical protein n=1 Tax=Paraburkholderia bannensis TaxID=765414 RepID=UPI002ABDA72A|nr:hypothetical protein [Paraburkholderia bannensis]